MNVLHCFGNSKFLLVISTTIIILITTSKHLNLKQEIRALYTSLQIKVMNATCIKHLHVVPLFPDRCIIQLSWCENYVNLIRIPTILAAELYSAPSAFPNKGMYRYSFNTS